MQITIFISLNIFYRYGCYAACYLSDIIPPLMYDDCMDLDFVRGYCSDEEIFAYPIRVNSVPSNLCTAYREIFVGVDRFATDCVPPPTYTQLRNIMLEVADKYDVCSTDCVIGCGAITDEQMNACIGICMLQPMATPPEYRIICDGTVFGDAVTYTIPWQQDQKSVIHYICFPPAPTVPEYIRTSAATVYAQTAVFYMFGSSIPAYELECWDEYPNYRPVIWEIHHTFITEYAPECDDWINDQYPPPNPAPLMPTTMPAPRKQPNKLNNGINIAKLFAGQVYNTTIKNAYHALRSTDNQKDSVEMMRNKMRSTITQLGQNKPTTTIFKRTTKQINAVAPHGVPSMIKQQFKRKLLTWMVPGNEPKSTPPPKEATKPTIPENNLPFKMATPPPPTPTPLNNNVTNGGWLHSPGFLELLRTSAINDTTANYTVFKYL